MQTNRPSLRIEDLYIAPVELVLVEGAQEILTKRR